MNYWHANLVKRQRILEQFHLVRCLERVISANAYQGIDIERPKRRVHTMERSRFRWIGKMRWTRDRFAGIGSGRSDHNPRFRARELQPLMGKPDVMLAFDQRRVRVEINQIRITMFNSKNVQEQARRQTKSPRVG
jgi:hypothetical protein